MQIKAGRVVRWCLLAWLAAIAANGCSSSGGSAGGERQACYGNGTCNPGLICLSQSCVHPSLADASGAGGNGGSVDGGGSPGGAGGALTETADASDAGRDAPAGTEGGPTTDAGGSPDGAGTGAVDGGETTDAAVCSPDAVTATRSRAGASLHDLLENTGGYCLAEQTAVTQSGTLSVCTTAACANMPNTCVTTLALTSFAFTEATLGFTATADIVVSGGAAGTLATIPVSCNDLTITAPGTTLSGTLVPMIQAVSTGQSPSNVLYTLSNVTVTASSPGASGCGVIGSLLTIVASSFKPIIEQYTVALLQGKSFALPCSGAGGAGGAGGADSGGG